jgi:hypothetical protein
LEAEYIRATYVSMNRKLNLSCTTGLSERQVKIWFQNRRAKDRRRQKKQKTSANCPSGICTSTSVTGSSHVDNAAQESMNFDVSPTSTSGYSNGCSTSLPISTIRTANAVVENFQDCSRDDDSESWCYQLQTIPDNRLYYGIH